jgi:hypothetical protein
MQENEMLAEYSSIRDEIRQLNSQAFTSISGSLTLNLIILGWMLGSSAPSNMIFLPFMAFIILITANFLIAHKIRAAHRLALYQLNFIENNLPQIRWARVYFDFRKRVEKEKGKFRVSITERFDEVQLLAIVVVQIFDILIIGYYGSTCIDQFLLCLSIII